MDAPTQKELTHIARVRTAAAHDGVKAVELVVKAHDKLLDYDLGGLPIFKKLREFLKEYNLENHHEREGK